MEEKKDYIPHSVSKSDVDFVLEVVPRLSLENVLWELGLNTKEVYYAMQYEAKHVNLQGHVVDCPRWEGKERDDEAWMSSGGASLENYSNKQKKVFSELEPLFEAAKREAWY